ncbi:hypothetical protein GCM10022381_31550 [Leifsonia kafniensis]|uniref:YdbS-like PH domain-containing protein n=1 Tax=Leifsonia kafniensis TaxID=475957 RepID=A0ABP7KX49_9MICO
MSSPARTDSAPGSLADGEWHRLYPASPLLRGGIFVFAILGFIIANLRERLIDFFFGVPSYSGDPLDEIVRRGAVGWALLVVAVVLIVILVGFYLSWRMHTFRVSDESVEVRSGILFRSHRKARLDRIQGVNIVRPLIPRLFGAAKLEVSVAGQDANVQLAYLGSALADGLRRDILRLASGVRQGEAAAGAAAGPLAAAGSTSGAAGSTSGVERRVAAETAADGPRHTSTPEPGPGVTDGIGAAGAEVGASASAAAAASGIGTTVGSFASDRVAEFLAPELDPDAAPPASVVSIPVGRLLGSIIFSGFTLFLIAGIIALIVIVNTGASTWILFAILPGLIGSAGYYFSRFTKSLRYSIAGTPDGVRIGYGLFSTSNETLPPGRIHAISVSQPLMWRGFGWWEIRVNKASHSSNAGAAGQANTTILPVGSLADAARVLELILPTFTADEQHALVTAGLLGTGRAGRTGSSGDDGYRNAPRRAAWLRPFSWRRTGYFVAENVVLIRRGRLSRELVLVPLARLQSVAIEQGPVRRMLRLASARLHTVAGPVFGTLSVVDVDEAPRLFERVARGAVESATSDTSHRWNQQSGPHA